jgi:hypothetical protein
MNRAVVAVSGTAGTHFWYVLMRFAKSTLRRAAPKPSHSSSTTSLTAPCAGSSPIKERLSGSELSVFYLHGGTKWVVQDFNSHFFSKLGIEDDVKLPCVVFFRVSDGAVESVEVAELQHADLIHGFKELYGAIESYINGRAAEPSAQSRAIRWMRAGGKFLSLEAFRAAIKAALEGFF